MFVKYRVENFLKLVNIRGLFIKVWVIFGYRYMCSYRMQIRKQLIKIQLGDVFLDIM